MSIKYEVIGRLGVRTERSATALALQQRQPHALALAKRLDRRDAGKRPAAFRNGDSLVGKILQQGETPAAKIRDAEVGHTSSVHQDVQLGSSLDRISIAEALVIRLGGLILVGIFIAKAVIHELAR
jgi:hypothetical protein